MEAFVYSYPVVDANMPASRRKGHGAEPQACRQAAHPESPPLSIPKALMVHIIVIEVVLYELNADCHPMLIATEA